MDVSDIQSLILAVQSMKLENQKLQKQLICPQSQTTEQLRYQSSNTSNGNNFTLQQSGILTNKMKSSSINNTQAFTKISFDTDKTKIINRFSDSNETTSASKQMTQSENKEIEKNLTTDFLQQEKPMDNLTAVYQEESKKEASQLTEALSSQLADLTFNKIDPYQELNQQESCNDEFITHISSNFNQQHKKRILDTTIQKKMPQQQEIQEQQEQKQQQEQNLQHHKSSIQYVIQEESQDIQYHLQDITNPTTDEKIDEFRNSGESDEIIPQVKGGKQVSPPQSKKHTIDRIVEEDEKLEDKLQIKLEPKELIFKKNNNQNIQRQKLLIRNISYENIIVTGEISNNDAYEFLTERQYYEKLHIELLAQEYVELYIIARSKNIEDKQSSIYIKWTDSFGEHNQTIHILQS